MATLFIPWNEIREVADNFGNIGLARDVAALGCALRRERPWLFQTLINAGGPIPGMAPVVANYFWERICGYYPPPPSSAQCQQFFGGQCPGVAYGVKFFDGNGVESPGTISSGTCVGPITCLRVSIGPENFYLDNPPIPTGYTVSGTGSMGNFSFSIDTKVATPRRDTRLFTYQLYRLDGIPDGCGDSQITVNVPPTSPGNTFNTTINFLGQRREITVNLPEYDDADWPDFSWQPIIEFDGIRAEFNLEGITVDLPDNVPLLPGNNVQQVVNNVQQTVNNIEGTTNNIDSTTQTINNTVNNTQQTVNEIQNSLQQEFNELNEQLAIDIQAILDAIERCCCKEGVTLQRQTISAGTAGGRFNLPEKTIAVLFELDLPETDRTPIQDGSGSAERVYHWGSYSIGYDADSEGDRIPLQWARQAVSVHPYSKCVTLWPTYLNTGSITAIYEEPPS